MVKKSVKTNSYSTTLILLQSRGWHVFISMWDKLALSMPIFNKNILCTRCTHNVTNERLEIVFCEILNTEQKICLPLLSSTDYIPKNVLEQKVLVHRVTLLNVIIVYHCFSSRNYYCFCACFNLIINYREKNS